MVQNLLQYFSFEKLVNLIASIPYHIYHIIMFRLVSVCINNNCSSDHKLPMIEVLVIGFVIIVYLDIYSIKQTCKFYNEMEKAMSGDKILLLARKRLEKRLHSNWNWLVILIVPAFILPVVIFIIKYPLGFPIKIFSYSALYIIISLCIIGYMQYVYLIMMAHECSKKAEQITIYDKNRPYKTEWLVNLASLTNKQSNLFFLVGAAFIALLYLITFTDFYAVNMAEIVSKIGVLYLWGIIALAIVIMFPVFSLSSYFCIKKLIIKLIEKEINECNRIQNMFAKNKKQRQHYEILKKFNQLKILMLEKMPVYPQKPFVAYAVSYIIALINFASTLQAAMSLTEYFK